MATEHKEKFKTMIGGQALIEGIMMRGPKLDAIVTRGKDGLQVETTPRKVRSKKSILSWPLIRGVVNFFDAQMVGMKALMHSADLAPEEVQEPTSKFDKWLEETLSNKKNQNAVLGVTVTISMLITVALFFLLPMLLERWIFNRWIESMLVKNLLEGGIRITIFVLYLLISSRMKEMRRVFSYHGAEHKTIRCYEAGLPLTVENVRMQTRKHPRCGTSFLFVIVILSILVFSVASWLLNQIPFMLLLEASMPKLHGICLIVLKLLLIPVVVSIGYELNRLVGRYDNWFTRILTAPGQWMQNLTTFEPDDAMIEVGIAALQAVIPEEEGTDLW